MHVNLRSKNSLVGYISEAGEPKKIVGYISEAGEPKKIVGNVATANIVLLQGEKGEKGDKGEPGKSAYEYAKDGGYTGTENEFYNDLSNVGTNPGGNIDFKTDETLTLKNGILSVNTTNAMEHDNTLPITSAGVYATVGNIEALLKTI